MLLLIQTIADSVAYACLCLQGNGGEMNGEETQTVSRSWLFPTTCDERGEDETASGVWRSHLQKWRVPRFIQRLVISLLLLVNIYRLLAASRMATKHKGMSKNGTGCLQRHVVSVEKIER